MRRISRTKQAFLVLCCVLLSVFHATAWELGQEHMKTQEHSAQPRALVLLSASYGRPGIEAFNAGLIKSWGEAGYSISQLSVHYLDLNQDISSVYRDELAKWIETKERGNEFDYIILAQQDAVTFFLEKLNHLSPNAVLISAFTQFSSEQLKQYNRKGLSTTQALDHRNTLNTALALFPKTTSVFVVSGATRSDLKPVEAIQKDEAMWPHVRFHYTSDLSYDETLTLISSLPENSIVLRTSYGSDKWGKPDHMTPIEIGKVLTQKTTAPTFVLYDTAMGRVPLAGGHVVSPSVVGERLIAFALSQKNVEKGIVRHMPLVSTPVYDVSELYKWGASLSAIPVNAERWHELPSFW